MWVPECSEADAVVEVAPRAAEVRRAPHTLWGSLLTGLSKGRGGVASSCSLTLNPISGKMKRKERSGWPSLCRSALPG